MQNAKFDPGLTQKYSGAMRRAINKDGTFNVLRQGTGWRDVHPYLHLVSIPWPAFFSVLLLGYISVNIVFATAYWMLGPDALQGGMEQTNRFFNCLYFSSQTLTTVGFGSIAPRTHAANVLAAFEALIGLLGFAVATGLLVGRVSRPSARVGFSEYALMTPYEDGVSLQFRMVNRRANTLLEPEVVVALMTVDPSNGEFRRNFERLNLERDKILFFALTWTVVHPITSESPLYGKTAADLERVQAELLILVKAWDETFSQNVNQRFSYRFDEIIWNARFQSAFAVNDSGSMVLDVSRVGDHLKL